MKNLFKTSILIAIFFFAASLKSGTQGNSNRFKSEGFFTASIDGKNFDSRSYNKYTAEVAGQNTDLTFFGGNYYDQSGNTFEESLQLKYAFTGSAIGEVSGQKMVFQFNNQKFLSIPDETKIKVTQIRFSTDHTSMYVSASFEGKMLQWVAPGQPQPIITVKGRMENINVSVPASDKPSVSL